MEKIVTFASSECHRDPNGDALICWFDFSVIDSSLIGTPRERASNHSMKITISKELRLKWGIDTPHSSDPSEDMRKVAFQLVLENITDRLKNGSLAEGELPPISRVTTNSEDVCPYNLSKIVYPDKKVFAVSFDELKREGGLSSTRLTVFISYSTTDRHIALQVKEVLDKYSIPAFLAHEDISISQEWKERIIKELNDATVFVLLLSKSFKKSDWAPQEVGMALTRKDTLIIPLSVDGTVPFGFMSHIQAKRISPNGIDDDLLLEPIIVRFPHEIIPKLISRLAAACSFRGAEALMLPLVPHFHRFNDDEIKQFATASTENDQIWPAGDCRDKYLPEFLNIHRSRIDPNILKMLKYQLEHGRPYT